MPRGLLTTDDFSASAPNPSHASLRARPGAAYNDPSIRSDPTVLAVLDHELASGIHLSLEGNGNEVRLADDSAAMGLMWFVRYFGFFVQLWAEPREPTFKVTTQTA